MAMHFRRPDQLFVNVGRLGADRFGEAYGENRHCAFSNASNMAGAMR